MLPNRLSSLVVEFGIGAEVGTVAIGLSGRDPGPSKASCLAREHTSSWGNTLTAWSDCYCAAIWNSYWEYLGGL